MKILYVIANLAPRYGGPPKACFEMARAMAGLGHTVSIYSTNQDGSGGLNVPLETPLLKDGVEIWYFPIQRPRFWGCSIKMARRLSKVVASFDVVHIYSLYLFHNLVSGRLCRKYDIPYLISPHGTLDPYIYHRHRLRKFVMELLFERKNFKHSRVVNFTTEEEMNLASGTPLMRSVEGVVVPLGLDLEDYADMPEYGKFKSKYPVLDGKKVVLFFGRINFKKGLEILVEAFSTVTKCRSDVHLIIAGPDDEGFGAKVKKRLAEKDLSGRVIFTGLLQGKDKLSVLKDADVFVLPSYSENFGISVIEAMACGLPVIVSDKVNIWREISRKQAGMVIPCESNRLAESILELLDNPSLANEMGHNGQASVREQFVWSKIAYELENVYRNAASENHGQRSRFNYGS